MNILKSFFFSSKDNKFKAPYFWSSLILLLFVIAVIIHVAMVTGHFIKTGELNSLVSLITVLAGLVVGLIAVYNQGRRVNSKIPNTNDSEAYTGPDPSV